MDTSEDHGAKGKAHHSAIEIQSFSESIGAYLKSTEVVFWGHKRPVGWHEAFP